MARVLSAAQARIARVRSQRLAGPPGADAHDVVHGLLAVPAQDTRASRLAVRPRCRGTGIDAVAVVRACNQERSLVRTWLLRGTLHMAAAEDVRWLVALLGPVFAAGGGPRRLRLGLDEDTLARGLVALREILAAEGPLTRATLVEAIAIKGVVVAPRSQAPAHLVGYAAKRGLLCRGPDLEHDEPTYVLLDDWVDRPGRSAPELTLEREPEVALAELARRYLRAHAPAGDADFAAWSALPLHQAKRGFRHLISPPLASWTRWTRPDRPLRSSPGTRSRPQTQTSRPGPRTSGCSGTSTRTCSAIATATWCCHRGSPSASRRVAASSTRRSCWTATSSAPGTSNATAAC